MRKNRLVLSFFQNSVCCEFVVVKAIEAKGSPSVFYVWENFQFTLNPPVPKGEKEQCCQL